MSLDPHVIQEIAVELAIDPAFVEKDWHSVQVLKALSEHESDEVTTIFGGGTSLSKGHGLLQRFSEDLDFRCSFNNEHSISQQRKVRSAYRRRLVADLQANPLITLNNEDIQISSLYIKFPLTYPQHHPGHTALRPHLEVEFSFTQPRLEPVAKPIQSFVSLFTGSEPETNILCLSEIETGADKMSALTWRVLKRDRSSERDDPTIIRHLHDLSALRTTLQAEDALFVNTAKASFEHDQKTGVRTTDKNFVESMEMALNELKSDATYQQEYRQFVEAMSYADDDDRVEFSSALDDFEALIRLFYA